MKILLVTEYYVPHIGGVEFVFSKLARELTKRGHECHVVTCRLPNTEKDEEIRGVKVHRVKVPHRGDRYWFSFLAIPTVIKLARQADLIHTTTFTGAVPAWLASKLVRKKCVITVHEVWGALWSNLTGMNWIPARFHQFLERLIISLNFDKYICVSRFTRSRLRLLGIQEEKLGIVYNGISEELFDPSKANGEVIRASMGITDEFVYMYYGRPGISKGVEYLIQAVPFIAENIPNSKLLLILAEEPRDRHEYIIEMIRHLRIEDRILLFNPVPRDELPNYIAAANCVVVPSLSDGFGFTAAEACAMEKPVVVSDVASLPEVVSGRYVLVEPRNPAAIAEGVEKVYRGETATSEKKIFSWDDCLEGYLRLYEKTLRIK